MAEPSSIGPGIDGRERRYLGWGFALFVVLRLLYPFVLRVDSDEPQHLHVVWGWAKGMLQYRDLFDNHAPLFQMLCSPIFRLFGERADIVVWMRLAMVPLSCLTLWSVYKISLALYSHRTALWTTLATAFVPVYFFTSTEFRTDDLWVVFWMLSLMVLVTGKSKRLFWTGFFLGCSFATSMKTSLLLGSLLVAGVCVGIMQVASKRERPADPGKGWGSRIVGSAACLVGLALVPLAVIGFFYFKGALPQMYYCVITHNVVPHMKNGKIGLHSLGLPVAFPFLLGLGYALYRRSKSASSGAWSALLFLTASIYLMTLWSYWPLITAQDYLPFVPPLCIVATPLFLWASDRSSKAAIRRGAPALAICALVGWCIVLNPFWHRGARGHIRMVQETLDLTRPDEIIMDGKGETIFRKRAFYFVLEGITDKRMHMGLITNNIKEEMIKAETAVVHLSRLKGDATPFVRANYLLVGDLYLLGKMLSTEKKAQDGDYHFEIAVPSDYQFVGKSGPIAGANSSNSGLKATLDGIPWTGPRRLPAGKHELQIVGLHGPIALFWARAADLG